VNESFSTRKQKLQGNLTKNRHLLVCDCSVLDVDVGSPAGDKINAEHFN
jgi:hypothetical protein